MPDVARRYWPSGWPCAPGNGVLWASAQDLWTRGPQEQGFYGPGPGWLESRPPAGDSRRRQRRAGHAGSCLASSAHLVYVESGTALAGGRAAGWRGTPVRVRGCRATVWRNRPPSPITSAVTRLLVNPFRTQRGLKRTVGVPGCAGQGGSLSRQPRAANWRFRPCPAGLSQRPVRTEAFASKGARSDSGRLAY